MGEQERHKQDLRQVRVRFARLEPYIGLLASALFFSLGSHSPVRRQRAMQSELWLTMAGEWGDRARRAVLTFNKGAVARGGAVARALSSLLLRPDCAGFWEVLQYVHDE